MLTRLHDLLPRLREGYLVCTIRYLLNSCARILTSNSLLHQLYDSLPQLHDSLTHFHDSLPYLHSLLPHLHDSLPQLHDLLPHLHYLLPQLNNARFGLQDPFGSIKLHRIFFVTRPMEDHVFPSWFEIKNFGFSFYENF